MNKVVIRELVDAATPFLSGNIVDETNGTILLMERLDEAIFQVEKVLTSEPK